MSKLSQSFRQAQGPGPTRRLMVMAAAMVLLIGVVVVARVSMRPADVATTAKDTSQTAPARRQGVLVSVLPVSDNTTANLIPTANDLTDNAVTTPVAKTDAQLFAAVVDGEPLLSGERDAYYRMVDLAWALKDSKPASEPPLVTRLGLIGAPGKYRAKLVRVQGRLSRVRPFKFDPDLTGSGRPREYYECAIGKRQKDLVMVLLFEDPQSKGIEVGVDDVRVDACFFKVFAYRSDAGEQLAPLLMGYGPVRLEVPEAPDYLSPAVDVLLVVLGVIVIGLWLWLRRGGRQAEAMRRRLERKHADEVDIPEPHALPGEEDTSHPG